MHVCELLHVATQRKVLKEDKLFQRGPNIPLLASLPKKSILLKLAASILAEQCNL